MTCNCDLIWQVMLHGSEMGFWLLRNFFCFQIRNCSYRREKGYTVGMICTVVLSVTNPT